MTFMSLWVSAHLLSFSTSVLLTDLIFQVSFFHETHNGIHLTGLPLPPNPIVPAAAICLMIHLEVSRVSQVGKVLRGTSQANGKIIKARLRCQRRVASGLGHSARGALVSWHECVCAHCGCFPG